MPDVYDMTGRNSSWLRSRIGHLTGSNMRNVVTYSHKSGWRRATDAKRMKLIKEIVAERMVDAAMDHVVTDAMQHGSDTEPEAADHYAYERKVRLLPAEFMLHPRIAFFGGTPDRLISHDGGLEIKCPATTTYVEWRMDKKVPEDHMPQIAAYLCITGRKWWDLAAYDPRIKKGPKMTVWRYEMPQEHREIVEEEARLFLDHVELVFQDVTEAQ
jgi:hypothetical protein